MKRRMSIALLLLSLGAGTVNELAAQPMLLQIRKEDSHIGFSITKWGVFKEEGRFGDFDGTIEYDPLHVEATKVQVIINCSSIDSRDEGRDRALRSEDFFHVTRYPAMKFTSLNVTTKNRDTLLVEGDLTIRGVTKRITIPVRIAGVTRVGGKLGTLVGFESDFVINREDFHVGDGWSIIDTDAHIHLLIGAGSQPTASR